MPVYVVGGLPNKLTMLEVTSGKRRAPSISGSDKIGPLGRVCRLGAASGLQRRRRWLRGNARDAKLAFVSEGRLVVWRPVQPGKFKGVRLESSDDYGFSEGS